MIVYFFRETNLRIAKAKPEKVCGLLKKWMFVIFVDVNTHLWMVFPRIFEWILTHYVAMSVFCCHAVTMGCHLSYLNRNWVIFPGNLYNLNSSNSYSRAQMTLTLILKNKKSVQVNTRGNNACKQIKNSKVFFRTGTGGRVGATS